MKQTLFLIISILSLASCNYTTGSGDIITETRPVGNFTAISVGGDFEVEVKTGPITEVRVEADDNIMKYIETRVSGNTLKIRTEDLHSYNNVHMKVFVTTPSLTRINASASARVDVEDVLKANEKLVFNSSSSGTINVEVEAPEIEADASSGATINLAGKTRTFNIQASSGADVKSFDLLSENTKVQVSSGASANVYASVTLNAQASSGASVNYLGGATVSKAESSGGSISKRN